MQCCYENYSAMQSNKRFNYSLVVPLLLLMRRVALRRPGRDNWGIWVEYSAAVAAHVFFNSHFCMCHCFVVPKGQKAQQFCVEKYPVGDRDLKRARTLQGKRTSPGSLTNPRWLDPLAAKGGVRMKPWSLWKKICFQVWFNLASLGITGLMWPKI